MLIRIAPARRQRGFIAGLPPLLRGTTPWWKPWFVREAWHAGIGVTITGSGVSSWVGRKVGDTFAQSTDAARMSYDGVAVTSNGSTQWIQTGAMVLSLPVTLVMVAKQPVWSSPGHLVDGRAADNSLAAYQYSTTPKVQVYNGAAGIVAEPDSGSDWAVNTWAVVSMCWSTTAGEAFIRTNLGPKRTGTNASATAPDGLTLGARGVTHDQLGAASFQSIALMSAGYTNDHLDQTIIAMARASGGLVSI